ncbi:MAG: tRNA (adenosine(37)-N6)-threonylcarbamoyltransferase complex dimerization subunit type 1 TsaB [Verrucomicrobia bacterium]|nr:tRNA (adenosine(37)-N6)-threonylcarbamoyltransferase complex dimerization subunit type 1 TsaB [Verrucomicrobiota bacterium]
MHWFAIETSSRQVSMAVGTDATCLRERFAEGDASRLVERLYCELNPNWQQIEQCVIGQGPGSYNGLRVGYAFLKGLLCPTPIPVVEVPSPLLLAAQAAHQFALEDAAVLVLNNARRNELYGAMIRMEGGLPRIEWETVATKEILRTKLPASLNAIVSYDYAPSDLPIFKEFRWLFMQPRAAMAGALACRLNLAANPRLSQIEPRYIRPPVSQAVTTGNPSISS